jgi:dipeptidase E
MKLLLTSAGVTNQKIADALFELVGKKPSETTITFVPTASNIEEGDKSWLIDDLNNLKNLNLKALEIADISAVPKSFWLSSFRRADVLFFSGGNTYHLMEWINKTGFKDELLELLKTKVWAGISAGSMVTGKKLELTLSKVVYGEDMEKNEDMDALGFVDFIFLPHLNSSYFPRLRRGIIDNVMKGRNERLYALDDQMALKISDGQIEVVGDGQYFFLN